VTKNLSTEIVVPMLVESHGLDGTLLTALQELTAEQVVAVATMSQVERVKAVRMALDFDAATPTMPTETRQQAERWLVSMARADLVAQILEGA
jgi:hypothetical protein